MAALAKLVMKTDMVVQKQQLIVNTGHAVAAFIDSSAFYITPGWENAVIKVLTQRHKGYKNVKINIAQYMHTEFTHDSSEETVRVSKGRLNHPSSTLITAYRS